MELTAVFVERLEHFERLDGVAKTVAEAVARVTHKPPVSTIVSGTLLGHPLHPVLTDLPIGCWTSAFVLDFVGGERGRPAAQTLVGLGVLSAVPTALTGLSDWADTAGPVRRIGTAHAMLNLSGLGCFALSWAARRKGRHARGVFLGLLGSSLATLAASLGGHLVYRTGTGVDVNAFEEGPDEWTPPDSAPTPIAGIDGVSFTAGGLPVLATRRDGRWRAIHDRCSHRGGPLHEGTFADDCVTCPWHHSRFRLDDGSIVDGPATAPQPAFEVDERDGALAVRRAGG